FPILGKIHVVGMTRMELTNYIKRRLIDEDYIKDPIVIVKFLNFKVSVVGDVGSPGVINVNSDRITIFEAISQAGDLAITGRRYNVTVIREENGERVPYYLDLRSKDVFKSPCYYLQQNDLVYVEPNKNKTRQGNTNQYNNITTWTTLLSFVMSIVTLIFVSK
ncbi:polysaccharide biosynthesis/export family protein, partial [Phocaeicola sp.]|uniref:polysaccharide biosynthesis/export family protein n=1 Tax=Phocaeicola sp. TaxID=2773926 RepID=UPI003A8FC100